MTLCKRIIWPGTIKKYIVFKPATHESVEKYIVFS